MILRKVIRLFGWMIASTAGAFLLYDLYQLVTRHSFSALLNLPTMLQTGLVLFFVAGLVLSTQNQILGGFFTFLSPLLYIIIYSIDAGRVVTPVFILLMLIGGLFLLFTADQDH